MQERRTAHIHAGVLISQSDNRPGTHKDGNLVGYEMGRGKAQKLGRAGAKAPKAKVCRDTCSRAESWELN